MDEATAGIDPISEETIVRNLKKCREGMTTIIITHNIDAFKDILTQTIDLGLIVDQEEED